MVEGYFCETRKIRGLYCKKGVIKVGGADLICWIKIRRLGSTAGAGGGG
jgi:hypothetical protein